jgi:hypothetical protein
VCVCVCVCDIYIYVYIYIYIYIYIERERERERERDRETERVHILVCARDFAQSAGRAKLAALPTAGLLRKDYKEFIIGSRRVGIASATNPLDELAGRVSASLLLSCLIGTGSVDEALRPWLLVLLILKCSYSTTPRQEDFLSALNDLLAAQKLDIGLLMALSGSPAQRDLALFCKSKEGEKHSIAKGKPPLHGWFSWGFLACFLIHTSL